MNENMDRKTSSDIPEEETIEELMSRFKPSPSSHLHDRMLSAPWEIIQTGNRVSPQRKKLVVPKLAWGLAGGLILLLILGITFVPPIQVIARQIMYSFIPAPSNQIEVQITSTSPEDVYNFSNPENFSMNVEEAQTQAGFRIRELSQVPDGFFLLGAKYDQSYNAIVLLYRGNSTNLYVTQRPIDGGQDVFSIGESAIVKNVMVGELPAELVTGGWKAVSTQPTGEASNPSSFVNITAIWDNSLAQSTLRWQKDGFAFELRSVGENQPSEDELIALANGLK